MAFAPIGPVVNKVIDKSVEFVHLIGSGLTYVKRARFLTSLNPLSFRIIWLNQKNTKIWKILLGSNNKIRRKMIYVQRKKWFVCR